MKKKKNQQRELDGCIMHRVHTSLIKFHDFEDNGQEGMKHQMRGATQAQTGHDITDNS
jgi:hypothetical protein